MIRKTTSCFFHWVLFHNKYGKENEISVPIVRLYTIPRICRKTVSLEAARFVISQSLNPIVAEKELQLVSAIFILIDYRLNKQRTCN